jgi:hypothetical protein
MEMCVGVGWRYGSTILDFGTTGSEWSALLCDSSSEKKESLLSTEYKAGWTPELVWML